MSAFTLPVDYAERVYAGVLGKLIGVYLGRPFEGWTYQKIMAQLGEITYYVNERLGTPLVVTDDDISGTFTFLRALEDYNYTPDISAAQIGQAWLNYIIEDRTVLWWGGLGNSTEHTAYLRLKRGIAAPRSGSIELNGRLVAEQIGAQIFIDGWAMVAPGNPALATRLASRAGSVSHDGEAVYAAQALAAMEAQAFVEGDIQTLLDVGLSFIPHNSILYRMIQEIRAWHREEPDWRKTRTLIEEKYGYASYGGGCHVIPNHALIVLALLYGEGEFQKSLMIVNTAGWDTDCNSGNVGCLLGIRNGLRGLDGGPDWRGPMADRLYLATADGGRAITDALGETYHIVKAGHALAGIPYTPPAQGARFHFSLPGSLQGFSLEAGSSTGVSLKNRPVDDRSAGTKSGARHLAMCYGDGDQPIRISTPTFIPPDAQHMPGYSLLASPTLYGGQTVWATLTADAANALPITIHLFICVYDSDDTLVMLRGPRAMFAPGEQHDLSWQLPDTDGAPIATVGIEISREQASRGVAYLDTLTWDGTPAVTFGQPEGSGTMWRRAWVDATSRLESRDREAFRLSQNYGRGMISQGTREWTDYSVSAALTPHVAQEVGLGVRVQGLQRYYALMLSRQGQARLVKVLDGETILAQSPITWELERAYNLRLRVTGTRIQAWLDDALLFDLHDDTLSGGGVALLCQEGCVGCNAVAINP